MKQHILFRFGQDFKGALNQLHYKHAIPAEVSLGRLEIRHRATTLVLHKMWFDNWTSSPQPSVVSASGKVLFTEIQTGILRKTMQRDNEPRHPLPSPSTTLFSCFPVERQHLPPCRKWLQGKFIADQEQIYTAICSCDQKT